MQIKQTPIKKLNKICRLRNQSILYDKKGYVKGFKTFDYPVKKKGLYFMQIWFLIIAIIVLIMSIIFNDEVYAIIAGLLVLYSLVIGNAYSIELLKEKHNLSEVK